MALILHRLFVPSVNGDLLFCILLISFSSCSYGSQQYVHNFRIGDFSPLETSSFTRHKRETSGAEQSAECRQRELSYLKELKTIHIENKYVFTNETNWSLSLAWANGDGRRMIVVTTKERNVGPIQVIHGESKVYLSTDGGRQFQDISGRLKSGSSPLAIQNNGVLRNKLDPKKVYIIAHGPSHHGSILHVTEDGGDSFHPAVELDFILNKDIVVHPKNSMYLLTLSALQDLWLTTDDGFHWKKIASSVRSFSWSYHENEKYAVYLSIMTSQMSPIMMAWYHIAATQSLRKLPDASSNSLSTTGLLEKVYSFQASGNFLYASVDYEDSSDFMNRERVMKVSTDGGLTWNVAQLPRITRDRFYSVLDMSEKLVFMHVDNPGDTGHGTLYTSGKDGIIYSVSLKKHLYPNHVEVTDFYKVQSMEGVYLASQLSDDGSIRTLITYNRGGTWQPVERPANAPCKDETKVCYLQIHNVYSLSKNVHADPPMSSPNAPGIILVHGHVANALQTTLPDVFISRDGGYTFTKALDGPHKYRITDYGGLIVAVSSVKGQSSTLKFSTNEGLCWHEYRFTNDSFVVTGVLSEPASKSLEVSIWGYTAENSTWKAFAIDFKKIIKDQCAPEAYEDWVPHTKLRKDEGKGVEGCLLGQKAKIQRLKPEAWCYNGLEFKREYSKVPCKCTREDYECEYGFYRAVGMDECSVIDKFDKPEVDICLRGHEEKIVTEGYRKIPGDSCIDGYQPNGRKIDLSTKCNANTFMPGKTKNTDEEKETTNKVSKEGSTIIIVIALVGAFLSVVMLTYFALKFSRLRSHKQVYKYSVMSQDTESHENPLLSEKAFQESSDEEELDSKTTNATTNQNGLQQHPTLKSYHDDSDDDMLR